MMASLQLTPGREIFRVARFAGKSYFNKKRTQRTKNLERRRQQRSEDLETGAEGEPSAILLVEVSASFQNNLGLLTFNSGRKFSEGAPSALVSKSSGLCCLRSS